MQSVVIAKLKHRRHTGVRPVSTAFHYVSKLRIIQWTPACAGVTALRVTKINFYLSKY